MKASTLVSNAITQGRLRAALSLGAARRRAVQTGFVLQELLLGVAIVAVLGVIGAGIYLGLRSSINADDMANKTIEMATEIQRNYRNAGTYASVNAVELNKIALLKAPIKFSTPNALDAWGNTMKISGTGATFAITIGGSTTPMAKDDCATVANKLGALATKITIGADADAASGVVSGTNTYKDGATYTQTSLTTGCSEANPVIAAQFR